MGKQTDLRARIRTGALVAAGLVAVVTLAPPWVTSALLLAAALRAGWEWTAVCGVASGGGRAAYALAVGAAAALCAAVAAREGGLGVVAAVALAWWLAAFVAILAYPFRIPRALAFVAGFLVLAPAGACMHVVLHERGPLWLLLLFVLVALADTFALFAGRRFGRRKLAPRVSGAKTWEGVAGGLAAVALAALVVALATGSSAPKLLAVGVAVGAISIVGDLTASIFKRSVGLDDYPLLLPGHGGIMDRIDSHVAAAPVWALGLAWAGAGGVGG